MVGERIDAMNTQSDPISGPDALNFAGLDFLVSGANALRESHTLLKGDVSAKASCAAVIVAGGSGERLGNPGGKQLFEVLGRPVLTWSVEVFDAVPDVGLIIIVCPDDRRDEYRARAVDPYPFVTPIDFAPAGDIRQESAMSGVEAVPEKYDYIIIHDGARPLVTVDLVTHALSTLKGHIDADGVVVGHPSIDTLKVVDGHSIVGTPDRGMFWVAQTPQVFLAETCRNAYRAAMYDGFVGTDDSSLVERVGGKVIMFNGPRDNIKVTVPEDVGMVAAALSARIAARER